MFSIILKGLGAVLEVLLQILITGEIGVAGYGTYSTWINAADMIFWVLFSGLVKCNTFYLSGNDSSIAAFKRRYYGKYVIPILIIGILSAAIFGQNVILIYVFVITGLELLTLDRSSTLLTKGKATVSLLGEYVLGRFSLVLGILVLGHSNQLDLYALLTLYIIQYLIVITFFLARKRTKKQKLQDISKEVSLRKWGAYQQADFMHSMIEQLPVVLQYFFSGAFEAGVVSIVLLVKKLINFISGPTAKIFLPEFSRLYHAGKKEEICDLYVSIMRIQMLAVGPLAVVLLGYSGVILRILAEELVDYAALFRVCSVVFLLVATLGPCGGFLQMTGNEKMDNRYRQIALLVMVAVMLITHKDPYFVLYGLCVQIMLEAAAKYAYICRWIKKSPVSLFTFLKWWIIPGAAIGITYLFNLQESFIAMIFAAGIVFAAVLLIELKNNKTNIRNLLKRKTV